jgi:1-acyl-sn-glycerol-3-phosphate acyltransferase
VGFTAFTFGYSYRHRGWGNIPARGPVLILANHFSMLDPIVTGLASRRYVCQLARENLFRQWLIGPLVRSLPGIPINREMGKEGIQAVLDALAHSRAVVVFPEGERSHSEAVQPLKPGVSLLIRRVKCPIVPMGIAGTFAAWSRFMKRPRLAPLFLPPTRATIAVSVGQPIDPARYEGMSRDEMLRDLHAAIVAEQQAAEKLRRK